MTEAHATDADQPIIAKGGRYYRNTRYLISIVILLGVGLWFAYDGWVNWPRENQEIEDLRRQEKAAADANENEKAAEIGAKISGRKHHSDTDLLIQRILGFVLPPAGILLLIWTLYNSRGAYRFSGDTLEVPGHPPVKLSEMRNLDRTLWDRKGIAYVEYETAAGVRGKLCLDDFVYERPPTDAIYDRIKGHFFPNEKNDDEEEGTI